MHLQLVQMNIPSGDPSCACRTEVAELGMLSLIFSNTFFKLLQNSFLVVPIVEGPPAIGAAGDQIVRSTHHACYWL